MSESLEALDFARMPNLPVALTEEYPSAKPRPSSSLRPDMTAEWVSKLCTKEDPKSEEPRLVLHRSHMLSFLRSGRHNLIHPPPPLPLNSNL